MKKITLLLSFLFVLLGLMQAQVISDNQKTELQTNEQISITGNPEWIFQESLSDFEKPEEPQPTDVGITYWQTPIYYGYYTGLGDGRGVSFMAINDFSIDMVGIQGDLAAETYEVVIWDSPDGHSAASILYSYAATMGGTGYGWNDITLPSPYQFTGGLYYVLMIRPTDMSMDGYLEFYDDSGLPFTVDDATLIDGVEGYGADNFINFLHPNLRINVINTLIPPENLSANVNQSTGEVQLNWDYMTGVCSEDFSDGTADNFIFSDGRFTVSGGELEMNGYSDDTWASTYYDYVYDDFTMEFEVSRVESSATVNTSMGAFIRSNGFMSYAPGTASGYLICITAGGSYSVWLEDSGVESNIISWQSSAFINTGLGASNIITIDANGSNFDIYINGNYVNSFTDATFPNGYCNVCSYDNSSGANIVTWDYINITPTSKLAHQNNPVPDTRNFEVVQLSTHSTIESVSNPVVDVIGLLKEVEQESKAFQYFNVYRDASYIGSTANTYYIDNLTAYGTYDYTVTAYYDEGESVPEGPVQVVYEGDPDIVVDPAALSETLLVGGSNMQPLLILNNGPGTLNATLDITYAKDQWGEPQLVKGDKEDFSSIAIQPLSEPLTPNNNFQYSHREAKGATVLYLNTMETLDDIFEAELSSLPNIDVFDALDAQTLTPNVSYLLAYDIVILASNYSFLDPVAMGNNLAAYVDAGGSVVLMAATMCGTGGWALQGAIMDPAYAPLANSIYSINNVVCSSFTPHPVTNGLTSIETGLYAETYLQGSGVSLGLYNSGDHFAAFNPAKPIVSLNLYTHYGYYGGDVMLLMSNTIDYLSAFSGWLSVFPGSVTIPGMSNDLIEVTFDASGLSPGVYNASIDISSNDPDEPLLSVPVALTVVEPIATDFKVFLEGPYFSGEMNRLLNIYGVIPFNQPFNTPPWNYPGGENVGGIPNPDIVDWILVELRHTPGDVSTATAGTVLTRRAGFLLKNGDIVDLDGISPLSFTTYTNDNVFAVIHHRNHLPVISANPLSGTGNISYDFTIAETQVYGGAYNYKEIDMGVWGMLSGNCRPDRHIDNLDKDDVWYFQYGNSGYLRGDLNLDTQVNDADIQIFWDGNSGKSSMVP